MKFNQKIKRITMSNLLKMIKEKDKTVKCSEKGLENIINTKIFWNEYVEFMIDFINDNKKNANNNFEVVNRIVYAKRKI